MIDPEDGPEDEMEKWSPDQWRRYVAEAERHADIEEHSDRFRSDLEFFRQAGVSVVLRDWGAELDGRILVSNRKRCWQLVARGRWYGYSDPSKVLHFLKTGEWMQSEKSGKRSSARGNGRDAQTSEVVVPAVSENGEWVVSAEGEVVSGIDVYIARLAGAFVVANAGLCMQKGGLDVLMRKAVEFAGRAVKASDTWSDQRIEAVVRDRVSRLAKTIQGKTMKPVAKARGIRRVVVAEDRKPTLEQKRYERDWRRKTADKAALGTQPVYPGRSYAVPADRLAELGVGSLLEFVERFNALLRERGRFPISQGDFPSSKVKFERLVKKWEAFSNHER